MPDTFLACFHPSSRKKATWRVDNWPWDLKPQAIFCLLQLVLAYAWRLLTPGQAIFIISLIFTGVVDIPDWWIQGAMYSEYIMTDKHPGFPYTHKDTHKGCCHHKIPNPWNKVMAKLKKKNKSINQATKTKYKPPTKPE